MKRRVKQDDDEMIFDTYGQELRTVFKDWEVECFRVIWANGGEPIGTREVWERLTPKFDISRASVINFLNRMVGENLLGSKDITGKGGHRALYYSNTHHNDKELSEIIFNRLMQRMTEELKSVGN